MQLIHDHLHRWNDSLPRIPLAVDRLTLTKRRWRGTATDGREFGFDLAHPLAEGDVFFQSETALYQLAQKPEPVLEIALSQAADDAARLGWKIGNLHFPLEAATGVIRVADDPALRQLFEREGWKYTATERVFHPLHGGHSHGHAHD